MITHQGPTVECQMMIRKPVSEVFQALIDPNITTKFWFTKSSGILEKGKTITWQWEMYGVSAEVEVVELIRDKALIIQWGNPKTTVHFAFTELKKEQTYVVIKNVGFTETGDELIEAIKNNTGGFTTVLDGMKAYLEYGIQLNLVGDKFPQVSQK
ncbi:MAG: SRPBCC family protein [Bacteroidota bacterium]